MNYTLMSKMPVCKDKR